MRAAAAEASNEVFVADPTLAIVLAEISVTLFEPAFRHDPNRAVNLGIMEQAMVGVAAGYALEGFRPILHTIAPFLAERALEQVKLDFGYQGLEGLLISTGASYDYSTFGTTHHSPGDVQALATVPGLEVVVPGTAAETHALVRAGYANGRLTYLRAAEAQNAETRLLPPGGLQVVRRGDDLTVVAVGPMLDRALAALEGIDATVLYATTAIPLDAATLAAESAPVPELVVVEPWFEGTLAPEVTRALAHRPLRLLSIGVPRAVIDRYGTREQLDAYVGLDVAGIRRQLHAFVGNRTGALVPAAAV